MSVEEQYLDDPAGKSSGNTESHIPGKAIIMVLFLVLLLLLPVYAYFFAFYHMTPLWLQWMLYGLLSAVGVVALADIAVSWRQFHPLLRWLDLFGALALLVCFSWSMFFTALPFQQRMQNSLLLAALPWAASKFLARRLTRTFQNTTSRG